ncbi:MAG TPA: DinB family protein [Thermoanaerobaculia bacterium]|nr:DinB family protein [Thermoanaerobaculia bacterium]
MAKKTQTFGIAAVLATLTLAATPLPAQTEPGQPDPLIQSAVDASSYMKGVFTKSAEQMSEEDYAFKPTPEVRSFGQLLAHVADTNYSFCAAAKGEPQPVSGLEKSKTTRADIQKAVAESFTYCDGAYAGMTDAKARTMVQFGGKPRPALAILLFRTHHAALHYGNVVTYMRLRGKVPPTSQGQAEG